MVRLIRERGFWGILALASWPNAAFDLCGICCGAFLMPFWQFFGATLLGARSMELFRRWGQDAQVYAACMPQNDAYYIVFCDRLAGHEIHRFASPPVAAIRARDPQAASRWRELAWSPYGKTQIGQQALEPVLLRHAEGLPPLTMRHGWRLCLLYTSRRG